MNWTFSEFHIQLKDLNEEVREKAIEIANRILTDKNRTKADAISEGIKQAEEWYLNKTG